MREPMSTSMKDGNSADRRVAETASKVHEAIQTLITASIRATAQNGAHATALGVYGASGALHVLADAISPERRHDETLSAHAVLYAAFLAYRSAPCETRPGHVSVEYSPLAGVEAMADFEKFTGQPPDEYLNPNMVKAWRMVAANAEAMADLRAKRSEADASNSTLYAGRLSQPSRHLH